ncbi:MAG: DUF4215 domain-containing protein [Proteobacteria bacterium]|nr:DUF4215 domain-containing protein [Pseudomonadota bacterium]
MKYKLVFCAALCLCLASCGEEGTQKTPGGLEPVESCGNGVIDDGEACDDGNDVSGDGCASGCVEVERGYACETPGEPCKENKTDPEKPGPEPAACGNRVVESGESCDDGNTESGDGCSADCTTVEPDWSCPAAGGACAKGQACGDGHLDDGEACDDGNTADGDGCAADCSKIEDGWKCPIEGQGCATMKCGDSHVDDGEACDNGDLFNTDYGVSEDDCATNCQPAHYCGDGLLDAIDVQYGEQCDAGGDKSSEYNGCTSDCKRVNYCGDGKIQSEHEQCDDGNTADGDGCDADCQFESNFVCVTEEGKSVCRPILCGNGVIDSGEACDDGNRVSGDGCSNICLVEKLYRCEADSFGKSNCTLTCGDKTLDVDQGEACDDGNTQNGDGCSSQCSVEPGYSCAGSACFARACGDGIVAGFEECDDGNTQSGDGCSKFCLREENYHCDEGGRLCDEDVCGDGKVTGDETCDEGKGNETAGCVNCRVQMGWKCPIMGASCEHAECGNSVMEGAETCDETSECCKACVIQPHCLCDDAGHNCKQGECGNGVLESGEECDDGNHDAGDGCSPVCQVEAIFSCKNGVCQARCGDGLTLWEAGEECDDGNLVSGDGCSSECKIEPGYTCTDFSIPNPPSISLPITYRDFRGWHEGSSATAPGFLTQARYDSLPDTCTKNSAYRTQNYPQVHWAIPDFQSECLGQNCMNTVYEDLDKDGKPVLQPQTNFRNSSNGTYSRDLGATYTCPEVYAWWYRDLPDLNVTIRTFLPLTQDANDKSRYSFQSLSFFPFINQGYHDPNMEKRSPNSGTFTSEFETYFRFKGGESLTFNGDDDAWVFINNKIAVDMGCMHGSMTRTVTLDDNTAKRLNIYPNGIYSIKMFHAERCSSGVDGSTYQITLSGFVNMGTSDCQATCGDGLIRGAEECDLGDGHVNDAYAQMAGCVNCRLAPKCGNGKVEAGEICDSGHLCKSGAAEGCTYHADVEANGCTTSCTNPNCNNGKLDPGEDCDCAGSGTCIFADAYQSGNPACLNCRISGCGDGILDGSNKEECDDGNLSDEDMCTSKCTLPKCGDGIVSPAIGEVCDDGINDGGYGHCGYGCSYEPPKCGDGIVDQAHGELCDDGPDMAGGYGKCTKACKYEEYCGDHIVQDAYEQCDDGDQNGKGSCTAQCEFAVN